LEEQAIIKNQKAETFFAIVLEFLPPTQTKNDMLTKFYVVDPSRKKPGRFFFIYVYILFFILFYFYFILFFKKKPWPFFFIS